MPCRVDDEDWKPRKETRHGMDIADFEATLCGVFTAAEEGAFAPTVVGGVDGLLDVIDWKEAGVKRKTVEAWWKRHKAEDAARLARESAERRKAELRKVAIGKLTAEELEVLGIKL
jgi:hypothetical protein